MDRKSRERRNEIDELADTYAKTLANHLVLLDKMHKKTVETLDDTINSRWVGGNTKRLFTISKVTLDTQTRIFKNMLENMFTVDILQKRLFNLEDVVINIAEKLGDIDLSELKKDVKNTKDITVKWKPAMKNLEQAMENKKRWLNENR